MNHALGAGAISDAAISGLIVLLILNINSMSLNSQKFSLLVAAASGVLYAVCSLFVALFPVLSTKLMGWLFHLSNPATVFGDMRVTLIGYIGALVEVLIYSYVVSLIFAWIFNKSVK